MGSGANKSTNAKQQKPIQQKANQRKELSIQSNLEQPIVKQLNESPAKAKNTTSIGYITESEAIKAISSNPVIIDLSSRIIITHEVANALVEAIKSGKVEEVDISASYIEMDDLQNLCESIGNVCLKCKGLNCVGSQDLIKWYALQSGNNILY